jgi:hypothetical protein
VKIFHVFWNITFVTTCNITPIIGWWKLQSVKKKCVEMVIKDIGSFTLYALPVSAQLPFSPSIPFAYVMSHFSPSDVSRLQRT